MSRGVQIFSVRTCLGWVNWWRFVLSSTEKKKSKPKGTALSTTESSLRRTKPKNKARPSTAAASTRTTTSTPPPPSALTSTTPEPPSTPDPGSGERFDFHLIGVIAERKEQDGAANRFRLQFQNLASSCQKVDHFGGGRLLRSRSHIGRIREQRFCPRIRNTKKWRENLLWLYFFR